MSGGSGDDSYDPAELGKTLGNKLTGYADSSAPVFNKNMYPGLSSLTQSGISSLSAGADPAGYSSAVSGAMSDFGDVAAGNRFGMDDPGYQQLRAKAGEDTLRDVNAIFSQSGRFGSGSHVDTATESLGNVYAGMDYQNHQNDIARQAQAAGMLPGLYQASQAPAMTQLQAGAITDADALAQRQGDADLFDRTENADYNRLLEMIGAFTGTQQNAGMQQEVPWWQSVLGYVAGNAGQAMRYF